MPRGGPPTYTARKGELLDWISTMFSEWDSEEECLEWPYGKTTAGYGVVSVNGSRRYVHHLACERDNGPRPGPEFEASHDCGNASCVNPLHIKWKSRSDNQMDRVRHGTSNRGERHARSKLTSAEVLAIRDACASGESAQSISSRHGISDSAVWLIRDRKRWEWL